MAYNYGAPPNGFGPPGQNYGAFPNPSSQFGPTSGAGAAPGMSLPPGMNSAQSPALAGPPMNFSQVQLPPGLNFNASVIRMTGPPQPTKGGRPGGFDAGGRDQPNGNRGRAGLGADSGRSGRDRDRDRDMNLQPLTKEEVARTIYVGGLVDGAPPDTLVEEILNAGRGLRRWSRVIDADGKPCDFGFAEYEDAASLEIATKLFEDLEVPLSNNGQIDKKEDGTVKNFKLMVIVDPQSTDYIKKWTKGDNDELQFKVDSAQDDLRSLIANYINKTNNGDEAIQNGDTDAIVDYTAQASEQAELLALPTTAEDELADIPADMRETVDAEIAAFRERSSQRDQERLRMEEELERVERERSRGGRVSRLASPPPSAPKGPAGGANGIPVGPRDKAHGVPTGPKGFKGVQIPKDYVNGVSFVNGNAEEEDDDSVDDEEIEDRKQKKRDQELEAIYLEQEKKWLSKERNHAAAVERQQKEESHEAASREKVRAAIADRLKDFDDDKTSHPFYKDRKEWRIQRRPFRQHERHVDERDRRAEEQEAYIDRRRREDARGSADRLLDESSYSISTGRNRVQAAEKQAFSLNLGGFGGLGSATQKIDVDEEDNKPKQNIREMENLLDDEDEDEIVTADRKPHKPVEFKPLAPGEKMTDEERRQASNELAKSIPNDTETLFNWKIQWEYLPDKIVTEQLRPYVQRKIMEALGVQEELLVNSIEEIIRRHGTAEDVVKELEETLDEEAEMVTRRVWKMVVFHSESGARGLTV